MTSNNDTMERGLGLLRALLSLIALAAASGCQQPGASDAGSEWAYDPRTGATPVVESLLVTDGTSYASAAPVAVRIANRTGRSLGYNLCRSRLEREDGDGGWRTVQTSLAEVCTAELRTLRPGQSAHLTFRTEPKSRPGRYRISSDVEDLQARSRFIAVSNTFMLARDSD